MAFFQQLRQLFAGPSSAFHDLSFSLIETLKIRPMLAGKQWEQLETIAASLPPDDFTRLLDGLCLTNEYAELLASYVQSGSSELRELVAGVHATFLAWQARSSVIGKLLTNNQVEGFAGFLNQASEHLNTAFTTPLLQAEAAARLVRVAMGLGEQALAQEAFSYCLKTNPTHLQGHLFFFNFLTPKWFGNEDALEEFVDGAPTPALRHLLQAMYVVELYQEASDSAAIVKQKVRNDNARRTEELMQIPLPPPTSLYSIYLANYLAGLHHLLGQLEDRNKLLRTLGTAITYYPWMYFGLDWRATQKLASN